MRLCSRAVPAVLLLAFGSALLADDTKKMTELQGKWDAVSITRDGSPDTDDVKEGLKVTVSIEGANIKIGGPDIGERRWSFKLDPTKTPKAIDLTCLDKDFKNVKSYGIYELKGDDLRFCLGQDEKIARPTEFKTTQDSGLVLILVKRAK